jgi:hypothetical protein
MRTLLDEVLAAHGGIDQWNKFDHLKAHLKVAGHIWEIKGKAGLLSDGIFETNTHKQLSGYRSLISPYLISAWGPGKITLKEGENGQEQVLLNPRRSFDGEKLETQWNDLQPHYFSNYAWWTYFTAPFNFTLPGYQTRELDPWQQDGETWRRLEVTFPDYIETHNKTQVFYYGPDGLLRRHDYAPDILQSVPSSQYVQDFKEFMGIKIPVTRRIYLRNPDGTFNAEPVMVSIDVLDLELSKK